jgi:outer membrane protein TolC
LVDRTGSHSVSIQQGLLTGGSVTLTYTDHYLNENAPTDLLNPSSAPDLSISFQHNLLQGFGVAVNARTITVMKMNVHTADLVFETQVVNTVSQVLDAYFNLAAAFEDIKAKRAAAETSGTFLGNVNRQVRLGALAPSDAINAEAQVASTRRDLVDAETALAQQEVQLKNLLSRSGPADPVLARARLIPVDRITIPEQDDLPPVEELVKVAYSRRSDLATDQQNEAAAEVSALGTRNGIRPFAVAFGSESQAGLAGNPHTVIVNGFPEVPDPYFAGGLGTALGQVFRRDFPSQGIGGGYFAPLRNLQAQADFAIDQLQLRQTQLTTHKDLNQVQVDVQNYVIAVRQARARYQAAVQNRILQQQLLDSEQKRFTLGASIPYNVIQQQRDLSNAQFAETAALVAYSTARVALDGTTGTLLSAYHITLAEARAGRISRPPAPLPVAPSPAAASSTPGTTSVSARGGGQASVSPRAPSTPR